MNLGELLSTIDLKEVLASGGIILVLAMTIIQISPIKANPWGWIAKKIGRAVNGEFITEVIRLRDEVQSIRTEMTEQSIISCRVRILRFGDEILHGNRHTHDHFKQTLADIDMYENYCNTHPNFKNSITTLTVTRIREVYQKCQRENDFI